MGVGDKGMGNLEKLGRPAFPQLPHIKEQGPPFPENFDVKPWILKNAIEKLSLEKRFQGAGSWNKKVRIISKLVDESNPVYRCPGKRAGAEDKNGWDSTFLLPPSSRSAKRCGGKGMGGNPKMIFPSACVMDFNPERSYETHENPSTTKLPFRKSPNCVMEQT
jgi:hypothetical protein